MPMKRDTKSKPCEQCGEQYYPRMQAESGLRRQRFCTEKCQRRSYNQARLIKYEAVAWRACAICEKQFMAHPTRVRGPLSQKYCSYDCARDGERASRGSLPFAERRAISQKEADERAGRVPRDVAIYFAGLLDGEGCVRFHANGSNVGGQIRVILSMTHGEIVRAFHERFGGGLRTDVHHRKNNPTAKMMYVCTLAAWDAYSCLKSCSEFMVVKKEHARLAMEFQLSYQSLHGTKGQPHPEATKRNKYYKGRFAELNGRGVARS